MMKHNIFATNFTTKALTFLLVEAIMFIATTALVIIISKLLNLPEWSKTMTILFVQGLVLFIATPLITARILTSNPFKFLSLTKLPTLKQIMWVTIAMVVMTPAMNLIVVWNESMHLPEFMSGIEEWMRVNEDAAAVTTQKMLSIQTLSELLITIFVVGVMTGIGEELTFRGIIQKLISDRWSNYHIAIWVTAIIFSAIHLQFFGFFPRMLLGAFFGYLLVWSKSIWLPIYAHFLNNSMAVVAAYMLNINLTNEEIDQVGTTEGGSIWAAAISVVLFMLCIKKLTENKSINNINQ